MFSEFRNRGSGNTRAFLAKGMMAGLPIGLGYFAVAFSLGIAARGAGLSAAQGFAASMLTYASAGQYAGFMQMGAGAAVWEIILLALVINARYLLMSCALSQRLYPESGMGHRMLAGACITDEIFGATIACDGYVSPFFSFGALLIAVPMWSAGTALGITLGSLLPARIVSALSVALYGMFIASIVPPAKKNRRIMLTILAAFAFSSFAAFFPAVKDVSDGTRTIILTVVLSAGAALLAPVREEGETA